MWNHRILEELLLFTFEYVDINCGSEYFFKDDKVYGRCY